MTRLPHLELLKLYSAAESAIKNFVSTELPCSTVVKLKHKHVRIRISYVDRKENEDDT